MRPEKESMRDELKREVEDSVFVILADFGGMSMPKDMALRGQLREVDASYKVVKNRVMRSLTEELGLSGLDEGLSGPTAMITGKGEVSDVMKKLRDFIKENDLPTIKVGSLDGAFLSTKDLAAIAELPSKDELLAKIVGSIAAPSTGLVNTIHQAVSQLVNVLKRVEEQKQA